jgi:hypothetical protein
VGGVNSQSYNGSVLALNGVPVKSVAKLSSARQGFGSCDFSA